MMRRPGHVVNDTLDRDDPPQLPVIEGFDSDLASANVSSWGGDATLFRRFFATSVAQDHARGEAEPPLPRTVLTLASLAAWRAGVLDLRQDAIGRLSEALEAGSIPPLVLASALGLQPGELPDFVRFQSESPFGWPARGSGDVVIARVGGFRGLGGPWTAPPVRAEAAAGSGRFDITLADGERWLLEADIFGSRLSRAHPHPADAPAPPAEPAASGAWPARLAVFDTSYLAWLVLGQSS